MAPTSTVISLGASLAVALSVVPMLASVLLKPKAGRGSATPRPRGNTYTGILRWALRHRAVTLLATLAVLVGSLVLVPSIGTEFIPTMDDGAFTVNIRMPHGTPLPVLADKVDEMAAVVREVVPAELITTTAGQAEGLAGLASSMGRGGSYGSIKVLLSSSFAGLFSAPCLHYCPWH